MILNINSNDISFLPIIIVDNCLAYEKSGIYIKIAISANSLSQLELNIVEAKIVGLSLFGIVRAKANSIIMGLLSKYSFLHVTRVQGNISIEIDSIKIISADIVDNEISSVVELL